MIHGDLHGLQTPRPSVNTGLNCRQLRADLLKLFENLLQQVVVHDNLLLRFTTSHLFTKPCEMPSPAYCSCVFSSMAFFLREFRHRLSRMLNQDVYSLLEATLQRIAKAANGKYRGHATPIFQRRFDKASIGFRQTFPFTLVNCAPPSNSQRNTRCVA